MLRTRIVTGLVLGLLAFALIFRSSPSTFAWILAAVLAVGSWEFRRLGSLDRGVAGWLLLVVQAGLLVALVQNRDGVIAHSVAFLTAACGVWLLMFLRLALFRAGSAPDFQYRIVSFASSLAALSFAWIALCTVFDRAEGSWWVLLLFLIIWSADTGAYFTGRALGRRKLAVSISPGKTVEGLVGGLLLAVLVSLLAVRFIPALEMSAVRTISLAVVTALVSVGGDLFISLHKRTAGVKDSGRIFPGHGGVLDRTDSLLAGAPFFALGLQMST